MTTTSSLYLTPGQQSLHETLQAIGDFVERCSAFPSRWTEPRNCPNEVLRESLAACGITSSTTLSRFPLTHIPAGSARECQAALEKTAGVWCSGVSGQDTKVVFTERPIDALAYTEHRRARDATVISIGRDMPPEMRAALKDAVERLPSGKTLVVAAANDRQGYELAQTIGGLAGGRQVIRDSPPLGRTWCDTNIRTNRDLIRSLGHVPWAELDRGR